mmetsp:Transcript_13217/g.33352  ORF Transcript_13217/g.33352 Transcript_13217/m.33352 type:complete len:245 (+) Transcript_13217:552-1286(+)
MDMKVEAPRHLSDRHMLRELLQLQRLIIHELAELILDDPRVRRALLQQRRAPIASGRDVRSAVAVWNSDLLHVLTVRALHHHLARLVLGLLDGDDNALHHHQLLDLAGGQVPDHHRLHGAKAALEVHIASENQLDEWHHVLRFVARHKLFVELLEHPLAKRHHLRGPILQSMSKNLTVLMRIQVVQIHNQVVLSPAAVLLQLLTVLERANVDASCTGRVVGILPHKLFELVGDHVWFHLKAAVH